MSLRKSARTAFAFMLAGLLFMQSPSADAMNVSPMVIELSSIGSRATGRIQVLNVIKADLPYEVRVFRVEFDAKGDLQETPADADFVVFPPQGVLKQNQRQMVRLQWVGGQIDSSRAYYVAINQLPVAIDPATMDKKKAAVDVQLVYHMKVLVTVAPPGAEADVSVADVQPIMMDARKASPTATAASPKVPGVRVKVRNRGKRYAMMAAAAWTVEGKSPDGKPLKVTIGAERMGEILGAGYVPALNGERTFEVPTDVAFGSGPISVKFSN